MEDTSTPTIDPPDAYEHPAAQEAREAEAEAASNTAVAEPRPLRKAAEPDAGGFFWGTGRRKSAVARVRIKPGEGKITINGKPFDAFFSEPQHQNQCKAPLEATGTDKTVDVIATTTGGGITGQAGAMLLGISRALVQMDPQTEPALRAAGFLTRDPREVERKKYGQPGARRRFQFSKR